MRVTSVAIRDFRNIAKIDFTPFEKNSFFVGENAQGKTNIIEAIRLALCGISHREALSQNFISFGKTGASVRLKVTTDAGGAYENEITFSGEPVKKTVTVNSVRARSRVELFNTFPNIFFSPEDLTLVKGSPSLRRDFLDISVGSISSGYSQSHITYMKTLKQKNALLKNYTPRDSELMDIYDETLFREGSRIIAYRIKFLRRITGEVRALHSSLCGEKDVIGLNYLSDIFEDGFTPDIEETYKKALLKNRARDIAAKTCLTGAHRDDISISVNSRPARSFASQGQCRSLALCLKLSLCALYEEKTGEKPVIFLDDVLSELDSKRGRRLLRLTEGYQCFITATDVLKAQDEEATRFFKVNSGEISPLEAL